MRLRESVNIISGVGFANMVILYMVLDRAGAVLLSQLRFVEVVGIQWQGLFDHRVQTHDVLHFVRSRSSTHCVQLCFVESRYVTSMVL